MESPDRLHESVVGRLISYDGIDYSVDRLFMSGVGRFESEYGHFMSINGIEISKHRHFLSASGHDIVALGLESVGEGTERTAKKMTCDL